MKSHYYKLKDSLMHIGTQYPYDKLRLIQLVNYNALLIIGALILLLTLSTNIISRAWTLYDSTIYIGGFSMITFFLFLNSIGKFKQSTFLAHILFSILFCIGALISGVVFVCCIMNIVWMVLAFQFLESSFQAKVLAGIQLFIVNCTIFFTKNIDYAHEVIRFNPVERSIVFTSMFVLLFVLTLRMTERNRINNARINKLMVKLKKTNKKILKKNKKIKRAYNEMERFSYVVSHDLKTPLRNMNTFASLLKRDLIDGKKENVLEYSDVICSNGLKLTNMINEILAYSRLSLLEEKELHRISLSCVIEPIKETMLQIYPNAEITFNSSLALLGSEIKLKMLFQNLIENGLKYNHSNPQKVSIEIERENSHIVIKIKDNGIGIKPEYQDQIFELFTRLHSESEFQGTGIGLSTCKKIVEDHLNGKIMVSSSWGQGSMFKIIIPEVQKERMESVDQICS